MKSGWTWRKTVRWYLREWTETVSGKLAKWNTDWFFPLSTWLKDHDWMRTEEALWHVYHVIDDLTFNSLFRVYRQIDYVWYRDDYGEVQRVLIANRHDEYGNERTYLRLIALSDPRPWGTRRDLRHYQLQRFMSGFWIEFSYAWPDPARDSAWRRYENRGPYGLLPAHQEGI